MSDNQHLDSTDIPPYLNDVIYNLFMRVDGMYSHDKHRAVATRALVELLLKKPSGYEPAEIKFRFGTIRLTKEERRAIRKVQKLLNVRAFGLSI